MSGPHARLRRPGCLSDSRMASCIAEPLIPYRTAARASSGQESLSHCGQTAAGPRLMGAGPRRRWTGSAVQLSSRAHAEPLQPCHPPVSRGAWPADAAGRPHAHDDKSNAPCTPVRLPGEAMRLPPTQRHSRARSVTFTPPMRLGPSEAGSQHRDPWQRFTRPGWPSPMGSRPASPTTTTRSWSRARTKDHIFPSCHHQAILQTLAPCSRGAASSPSSPTRPRRVASDAEACGHREPAERARSQRMAAYWKSQRRRWPELTNPVRAPYQLVVQREPLNGTDGAETMPPDKRPTPVPWPPPACASA